MGIHVYDPLVTGIHVYEPLVTGIHVYEPLVTGIHIYEPFYKMTGRSVRHGLWNTCFYMKNTAMPTKSFSMVGLSLHDSRWLAQVYYFDLKLKTPKEGKKAQWVKVVATKSEDLVQFPKSTWWKEKPDSWNLSPGFYMHAMAFMNLYI